MIAPLVSRREGPLGERKAERDDRGAGANELDARRRARARRNALLLGLLAAGFYVGYILFGLVKGVFPG